MPVRDLGYRGYEGQRVKGSRNTLILMRHGMKRAWGSWLVKLAVFFGWVAPVVSIVIVLANTYVVSQFDAQAAATTASAEHLHTLLKVQLWTCLMMTTLGAGAGAISQDLTNRGFQFYFAKPVTAEQYLLGRISAVALLCFLLLFIPGLFVTLTMAGTAPDALRLELLGLLLPVTLHSAIVATVLSVASVGISSLGKSRSLTMSAWMLLLFVPHVLGSLVTLLSESEWPWLELGSIPSLLGLVGDGLFRIAPETPLRWYHGAPGLLLITVGAALLSAHRLRRAEVIT